jgi:long-chain acyl-CoA synthetase
MNVGPGDHVAILSHTCLKWHVIEHAGLLAGAVVVGVDPHLTAEQIEDILRATRPRVLFADNRLLDLSQHMIANLDHVVRLVDGSATATADNQTSWQQFTSVLPESSTDRMLRVRPADPATLIYTSGTTGQPKAIRFTHGQLLAACQAIRGAFPRTEVGDATICWLPMSHLFQRMMNLVAVAQGATIYFLDDPRAIVSCASAVNPVVIVGVPRFFEKLREGIERSIKNLPRLKRRLVQLAFDEAKKSRSAAVRTNLLRRLKCHLLDRYVLARIRATLGRRIKFMVTGSAPIAVAHLEFFADLGWPLLEAYGISENSVPMAANLPGAIRFGTVGKPFPQNQLRIDDDGEILVKGAGVFSGYWSEPRIPELFTKDGYFRTGDLGFVDNDGFLHLRGRKSEIIKLSTGRKISPSRVEAAYGECAYVKHVIAVGDGQKQLVGLCTLDTSKFDDGRGLNGIDGNSGHDQLARRPDVKQLLRDEFKRCEQNLSVHERFANFAILPRELSVENGELTPTLKIRRATIQQHFAGIIDQLYDDPAAAIGSNDAAQYAEAAAL